MQIRSALPLLLVLGCATAKPSTPAAAPVIRLAAAPANECGTPGTEPLAIRPDASVSFVVRATACGAAVSRASVADRWYVRRHLTADEGRMTALERAAMAVVCVADGSCNPDVDPESFAYVNAYARDLDPNQVTLELLREVPAGVATAFLNRMTASLQSLDAASKKLDRRRREIFVDLPLEIRADRVKQLEAVMGWTTPARELVEEIDATLDGFPSPERLRALSRNARTMRDDALLQCSAKRELRDCLDGAAIRPLTERLVRLAIQLGDGPVAAAELVHLRSGYDHSTFATHLGSALKRAMENHQAFVLRAEAAKQAKTLEPMMYDAIYGNPGPVAVPSPVWSTGPAPVDYEAQIATIGETEKVEGVVAGSRGRGGSLQIDFDCGLARCGRPVLLAVAEARLLRIGEKIEAIVDRASRKGVVLYAYRTRPTERVVQVRGLRLGR